MNLCAICYSGLILTNEKNNKHLKRNPVRDGRSKSGFLIDNYIVSHYAIHICNYDQSFKVLSAIIEFKE